MYRQTAYSSYIYIYSSADDVAMQRQGNTVSNFATSKLSLVPVLLCSAPVLHTTFCCRNAKASVRFSPYNAVRLHLAQYKSCPFPAFRRLPRPGNKPRPRPSGKKPCERLFFASGESADGWRWHYSSSAATLNPWCQEGPQNHEPQLAI
jgi:hypothetical protein